MQTNPAGLDYARFFPRIESLLDDAADAAGPQHPAHDPDWTDRIARARTRLASEGRLRVALVGEYSAGKSSLIKALTGADVEIDADVATDRIGEFDWNGVTLVDTPGVQADTDATDHDRLSRQATVGADLVLFVITNELFTPRLADYLRFVVSADGLGLADKTALVVNKIDREQNPDATIVAEIDRSTPDATDLPVWFCATGPYNKIATAPEQFRARFLGQSRVPSLVGHIDAFVEERGALGRLLTPLQEASDILDEAQTALAESEDDRQRLELLRRQKRVLTQLGRDIESERFVFRKQARAIVLRGANGAAERVMSDTSPEEITGFFADAMVSSVPDLDANIEAFANRVRTLVSDASDRLGEMDGSPLALHVGELDAKRDAEHTVDATDGRPGQGGRLLGRVIDKADPKKLLDGASKTLKDLAEDPKRLRNFVYDVGKKRGRVFKPWEAVRTGEKLAKWAGRVGKTLPFVFAAVEFWGQVQAEKAEERRAAHAAKARASLRRSFSDEAETEALRIDDASVALTEESVVATLSAVDGAMTALTMSSGEQTARSERVSRLKQSIVQLRNAMTAGVGLDSPSAGR